MDLLAADCGSWMDSQAKGWARTWRMFGEQAFCITATQFSRRIVAACESNAHRADDAGFLLEGKLGPARIGMNPVPKVFQRLT
jgi:hypothetical protein